MVYNPDKWVVVKIDHTIYKVFACWYGGYAGSDSWKLNSGITQVSRDGFVYSFEGASGSTYKCHTDCYGTNFYGMGVLQNLIETAAENGIAMEILPEDTDWEQIDYGIS
jgi:hypothetical protein